ncbi:URC4/urg3 family protein [Roseomonas sp. OT10]|uniref:URC4/urg3 family protein n=1 Tax=Roseomonas cutis TaxID=2897332 RepID=UPI001E343FD5|nr:URC4/urg3 family protein [Roseomonas sp. OT10]UFN47310.1 URC4/urg3 family protein [Roseomonas sp. OT10]
MTLTETEAAEIALLRDPATVRARAHALLALGEQDGLPHFRVHPDKLEAAADLVAATIRSNYPTLDIPYHARWRHFAAGGVDRWGALAATMADVPAAEVARRRFDLCVVSVLLDAGAGPDWRYAEPGGAPIGRSEGLAVASLDAFRAGLFSGDPAQRLRADAAGLSRLDPSRLAAAFQVGPGNPLTGVEGRAALLHGLGEALRARPDLFGADARIGGLYDHLAAQAVGGALPATAILAAVLEGLGPIWPARLRLHGVNLGDVWRHRLAAPEGPAPGLVPFHKLSQWLSYSLVEALEDSGLAVTDLDALTGLPEYRNGGLFLDTGVLVPRDPGLPAELLHVDSEAVVEWRALTVALLDRVADLVRARLGKTAAEMPLARVLEGGTWAAGRRIAAEKRPGGAPPLQVVSDGTVF